MNSCHVDVVLPIIPLLSNWLLCCIAVHNNKNNLFLPLCHDHEMSPFGGQVQLPVRPMWTVMGTSFSDQDAAFWRCICSCDTLLSSVFFQGFFPAIYLLGRACCQLTPDIYGYGLWLTEPSPGNTSVLPVSVWLLALNIKLFFSYILLVLSLSHSLLLSYFTNSKCEALVVVHIYSSVTKHCISLKGLQ